MTRIYNRKEQTSMRRRLRDESPKAERLLWWRVRGRQLDGLKFRRQYGLGEYVVDFYCPEVKLAIEVDGETHFERAAEHRDAKRQAFIESLGIRVLRFTNPQMYDELEAVVEEIWRVAEEQLASINVVGDKKNPPQSPLGKGGGYDPPKSPLFEGGGMNAPPQYRLRESGR